ncbi:glutathione S-transferase [Sorangium cellulosum]|jgi:glutathione S-transferase|uniref:Glutathione S-transferase n=1 Tax=Sorangium cellulosum TaxID=56 RepID=A0A4P2Q712_SORCE|nr:glutathione S-transferase family protein [Sorangium cellulosum]AUX24916.1 glutathione S-transferase [Sorangium cellulosum]
MLTLFHAPQSRSSRIVWLLEELGAKYDIVYTSIPRMDGSGAADPANPHPDRKVPALQHDGALVTESIAIMLYLTDLYPEAGLAPRVGDPRRGAYLTWLAWYAGVVEPVVTLEFAKVTDNPALVHTFRGLAEVHARVASALAESDYILGGEFTAADILFTSLGQWFRPGLPEGQRIDDYLARCAARPAAARAMAKDRPG